MKASLLLIFIVLAIAFNGCESNGLSNESGTINKTDQIDTIRYGTSFGECLGYCIRSITLTESELALTKSGWDMEGMLPVLNNSESFEPTEWNALIDEINYDAFSQLDSVIGCPDCADGGAEWIQINKGSLSYKVVFEYMNAPDQISALVDSMRTYMNKVDFVED